MAFLVTTGAGLATLIGGLIVLTTKKPNTRLLAFGLAFAAGAMVFISLTEILTKSAISFSHEYGEDLGFTYSLIWFLIGVVTIATIDRVFPNPHEKLAMDKSAAQTHNASYIKHVGLMTCVAITIHNFPEGLATFFALLEDQTVGLSLALAITVHNIPEGVSIAIPVYFATNNKWLAIGACLLSGLAEPVGAAIGYAVLQPFFSEPVFGSIFGFIAGIMVFLALDELLPAAKHYAKGHETVYGLVLGMALMAISLIAFRF